MKLEKIFFSYGEKQVIKELDLELQEGQVTAISGPSGCGKTTLLRLMAGLEKPDSGIVQMPGLKETAILFQEDRLLAERDVKGQILVVLTKGDDVNKWLEAVGLSKEAHYDISQLSGGMKRRVAIARCMAYAEDKKLMLLDEPFTGVDAKRAAMIMDHIRAMGLTVVFTAHDAESLSLADRIVQMKEGRIEERI